jgi:hypothetical protein
MQTLGSAEVRDDLTWGGGGNIVRRGFGSQATIRRPITVVQLPPEDAEKVLKDGNRQRDRGWLKEGREVAVV